MNAYRVTLRLYERDSEDDRWEATDTTQEIITCAESLSAACSFAATAWIKADETDETEFLWGAVECKTLEGLVLLP